MIYFKCLKAFSSVLSQASPEFKVFKIQWPLSASYFFLIFQFIANLWPILYIVFSKDQQRQIFGEALKFWADVSGLTFREINIASASDIKIRQVSKIITTYCYYCCLRSCTAPASLSQKLNSVCRYLSVLWNILEMVKAGGLFGHLISCCNPTLITFHPWYAYMLT